MRRHIVILLCLLMLFVFCFEQEVFGEQTDLEICLIARFHDSFSLQCVPAKKMNKKDIDSLLKYLEKAKIEVYFIKGNHDD